MRPTFQRLAIIVLVSSTVAIFGVWVYKTGKSDSSTGESSDLQAAQEPQPQHPNRTQVAAIAFRKQVKSLLAAPVPITLDKASLRKPTDFSCGETHVVEFKSYHNLKSVNKLKDMLPETDLFEASRSGRIFRNCAVVGNSGSLLETHYGQEIDAHDIIIRFNQGITEGYREFVGSRTTFRVLNGPFSAPKDPGEITLSTVRDKGIKRWVSDLREHPERNTTAYVFDPEFLCYSWQWVRNQGHKPSSGLVGIIFALKTCRRVHAYGFQSKNYFSSTARPHYFDWERPAKGREKVHPFQREMALFKQLEKLGFLKVRHSDRPNDAKH